MNEYEVVAQPRDGLGTNASRRLRRTGRVPAILYGGGKDPMPLSIEESRIKKQIENEAFASHVLTVKVEDEESQAVLKSVHRDPATERVIHMDFQRISASSEIHMHVPLHFINEEDSPGKKAGGIVTHLLVEVEVGCLPKDLPEYIEVDMASLDVGDSVHLSELALPEGVHVMALAHNPDNDQPVVSVQHPQKLEAEPTTEEEEFEELETPGPTPSEVDEG
jgi:large subunit ribosomal protein L25